MTLAQTVSACRPQLHGVAYRILRNVEDAEDAVQDALLFAHKHLGEFRGEAQLSTWLSKIVINQSLKVLRKRSGVLISFEEKSGDNTLIDVLSDHRLTPEAKCIAAQAAEFLHDAIAKLSPTCRQAVQLRDLEGLPIRHVANVLGVPEGTIKARTSRGRRDLSKLLRKVAA